MILDPRPLFPVICGSCLAVGCFNPADEKSTEGSTDTDASASTSDSDDTNDTDDTNDSVSTTDSTSSTTASTSPLTTETSTTATSTTDASTTEVSTTGHSSTTGSEAFCGDGNIDDGEECDDGADNGPGMACNARCVLNVCGDGDAGPDEACDDGVDNGTDVGQCAPDCSKLVEEKLIVLSETESAGNLGANPVATADGFCPAGYAAMFVFGDTRRATTAANEVVDPIDWVITPWTRYINADSSVIWQTDEVALLGVVDGAFTALDNPVTTTSGIGVFTGLEQDWTTLAANDCSGWSIDTNAAGKRLGIASLTNIGVINNGGTSACNNTESFYCVEQ